MTVTTSFLVIAGLVVFGAVITIAIVMAVMIGKRGTAGT